jgi:formylglycine-generating enzyme required for sulfatase activity/energy-coupling factor transporter ATP-binding protein EcfA2
MSDDPNDIQRQIAELEAVLQQPLPDSVRQMLEDKLRVLRSQIPSRPATGDTIAGDKVGGDKVGGDKVVEPHGQVDATGSARIYGPTVGLNLGTIIYGRTPDEDEQRRLVWYLSGLAARLYRLPLRGLEERLDQGDGIALPQVYVMLATESHVEVARGRTRELRRYYEDGKLDQPLKADYDPDQALPDQAIVRQEHAVDTPGRARTSRTPPRVLARALLATEAVQQHQRLVLLGSPGSGKSTFVRHLAWALAQQGLDQGERMTIIPGWADQRRLLPIILPLRTLAGRLAEQVGGTAAQSVEALVAATLRAEMQRYDVQQIDDVLREALQRGVALLLCDGLDEVPVTATATAADRRTTLEAVRAFATLHSATPVVITCRTRAFADELRGLLGWPVETLAPFTLGQVRAFVPAWYGELVAKGQITPAQADTLEQGLLSAITDPRRPRLRAMAATPLLLTMMALVLYNKGELPRDRPQLYERILDLLLGQWDQVRDGQSLAEALGQPAWSSDRLRPLLDQLSYQAHTGATSEDGRGRLAKSAVRDALIDFFEGAEVSEPWQAARRCLDYMDHRSGLLAPEADETYVFAHLTLQEHCAGRYMLLARDAVSLVLQHRADDRWREPIFLGLGVVQQANPWLIESVLRKLLEREEDEQPKPIARWYRDLILAAEIGADRDWAYLREQRVDVGPLQRDLKRGLVELLQDRSQPLPVAERVRAGFLLGDLGDPRVPVTLEEWRRELERARAGDTGDYFCRVPAGTYIIGSADDDPEAREEEKPQHQVEISQPFLVARFPITNAQWQEWVEVGGKPSYAADEDRFNSPNQPVVAVTWRMCNDFCAWLGDQLGITIRLPTEAEWEAAARGGDARRYPWGDDWREDCAATAEDQETREWAWNVPVGCYPAGAVPCGALDLAGNVWEWMADVWQSYPGAEKPFTEENRRALRGGSGYWDRTYVRCGARFWDFPVGDYYDFGFRVVAAPPLAQMS